jgi:NADPH-dependent curcumin reductase CurA
MNTEKIRSIIRESIQEYIKEIDSAGTTAMYEAKMKACDEAIEKRMKKIEMAESLEEMQGMFDESKMKDLKTEIKVLEKQKAKYGKMLEKLNKGKEVVTEEPTEEAMEAPVEEADITAEMTDDTMTEGKKKKDKKDEKETMNESFLKMQKLAGVITEAQMREKLQKLNENMETKPYDALLNKVKQYEGFEDYVGSFKKFFQGKNTITKDEWMKWSGTIDGGYDPEDLASEIWNQS